ncbi:uncharacterized protein LOC116191849 isoform X2 [Punica granatum]|uniref:Uncharacterized protein LOC116191849 isoform X2 n=1 Tax=Punica granatum TaxID=22663 RepID=A0A6P8C340_PUNGR|nr:uncharacterized protein LOC116191849 isoform X2 [Punica granatum]
MFAKRLLEKAIQHHGHAQLNVHHGNLESKDIDFQAYIHYGIPSTASILAFDPIQRLLAIGTLDGRIKVIGGDGIEGLLISTDQLPFKHLEFLQNQCFLVSLSNGNYIQVWNLESRSAASCLQWESNITAFSVISGSSFIYIGDECGSLSVLKFDAEDGKLLRLPYHITASSIGNVAGISSLDHGPIVGVLHQHCPTGNRVLVAYQSGLLVLWDVAEAQAVFVGGDNDLQLKEEKVDSTSEVLHNPTGQYLGEKEISALCWASSDESVLAVGYVDGDILFWNTSNASSRKTQEANSLSSNVVRLQLSSEERRLPIVILQWSPLKKSHNGLLFIYGGDQIGSDELLTVLNLEWSSGLGVLKCIGRADVTLAGSFADMILTSGVGMPGGNHDADVFVLTNPGKLHLYDHACLYNLMSQQEGKATISGLEYEAVIPTSNPVMTVAKLIKLPTGECLITDLVETSPAVTIPKPGNTKWPLTGGVPGELSTTKKHMIERLYISGYQDGSVRICDATHPILSSICILQREVQEVQVADSSAPVSSLDLCISTLSLAVGDDRGLVYIYNLKKSTETSSFHLVTDSNHEVHALPQERENCKAVFSLLKSPVQVLLFANDGSKLAVGYQCGQVNVLDMNSFSPLFCSDSSRGFSSPVISMTWKSCSNISNLFKTPKHRETGVPVTPADEVLFVLTKDAKVFIVEGRMKSSGSLQLKKKSSPISMYVIEVERSAPSKQAPDDASAKESTPEEGQAPNDSHDTKQPSEDSHSGDGILDSFVLLCLEDSLQLYSTKSVIQGNNKTICKVKHAKRCCWTSTFKKDEAECGLILLYQTGDIEIRSLPDLELVRESSLMSILRWNYKAKIDKTMSSDCGQIAMVNGGELAFISLTSGEANSRILEFLPCLHDKVLAAAADAALNIPSFQKKKAAVSGILEGIAKGFKVGKAAPTGDSTLNPRSTLINLEAIFSKSPFPDPSPTASNNQDVLSSSPNTDDKEPELSIDDIDIDDPIPSTSASSHKLENNKNEKEKLFDGATDVSEPRIRTVEEIRAKYRKVEDASSVAADARNKLLERQEKLERISRRTAELQSGAEDFASLANELVKTMENRKWWHI